MKKKKKFRLFVIIIILIGILIYFYISGTSVNNEYNEEALNAAGSYNISEKLETEQYSKTLEEVLINDLYNDDYFDDYLVIEYIDEINFLDNVTQYLNNGYSGNEINDIYTLSSDNQAMLLKYDYIDFNNYKSINNFNVDNYDRYENYLNNTDLDIETVVTYVNIGLDNEQYTNINDIIDPYSVDVLVNKYNKLPDNFVPEDLISIPGYEYYKLDKVASEKLLELISAALVENIVIAPYSAYRSYTYQEGLYDRYASANGTAEADTYSARAGHSEHQTGLAVDIKEPSYSSSTVSPETYEWILDNAHKYGFIVRYTENNTHITGYIEEPWHLRYLGEDLATKVVDSNLTYDEYYDLHIKEY